MTKIPDPIFPDYTSQRVQDIRNTDGFRGRVRWVQARLYELAPQIPNGGKIEIIDKLTKECRTANGKSPDRKDMYEIVNGYLENRAPDFTRLAKGTGGRPRRVGRPRKMIAKTLRKKTSSENSVATAAVAAEKAARTDIPPQFVLFVEKKKAELTKEAARLGIEIEKIEIFFDVNFPKRVGL